jgi:hypothetical protein
MSWGEEERGGGGGWGRMESTEHARFLMILLSMLTDFDRFTKCLQSMCTSEDRLIRRGPGNVWSESTVKHLP